MNPDDLTPHLERYTTYEEACRGFRLNIPERFNIAAAICRRHTDAVTRVALSEVRFAASNTYTFGALDYLSDKFATALGESGILRGDVVAVMLRQSAAFAVAHFGALKFGAIVQPLASNADLMQATTALEDSNARALVVDEETRNSLVGIPASVAAVFVASDNIHSHVVAGQDKSFWREVYEASADFGTVETDSTCPAFIVSTRIEGGSIKRVSHSHAALIGNLPAFEMVNNLDIGPEAVLWASTEWASVGMLLGVIYPAWYYGLPVLAHSPSSLSRADLLRLLESRRITVALLESSDLLSLRSAYPAPGEEFDLKLNRVIVSEAPAREIVEWARIELTASVSTVHGTLEAGAIAATCETWFPSREGSAGKSVPGRTVEIVDVNGNSVSPGERGRIAIGLPDSALFCQYAEQSTALPSLSGEWFVTEESGFKDVDGYLVVLP